MDDKIKVLKGYVSDQATAIHDIMMTTTDPDVGNACNNMVLNDAKVMVQLEDICLKDAKQNDEKKIAEDRLNFDEKKFNSEKDLNDKKFNLEKDIQEKKLKLDNERLEFDKKKVLEYDKDIQERKIEVDEKKIEFDKDLQERRLELEKDKLDFEKDIQKQKLEFEKEKLEFEREQADRKAELEEQKVESDTEIQERRLKLEEDRLRHDKEEGLRKAEEAKANRKSDILKGVLIAGIGLLAGATPVIIKAIADANADKSKIALVKSTFNAIYEAEAEGNMPFSGEGGGLLRKLVESNLP